MAYKLTLLLEEQQEGGYTITCRELPELLTECDSLDDMIPNVMDALTAVIELYEYRKRPLPLDIQSPEKKSSQKRKFLLETVVPTNEISGSSKETETAWV